MNTPKPTPSDQQPLVSVLICAYNTECYIEESVRAVMNQTYSNLEIIIVNDGSTDNTKKILDALALEDSRIKVINNEKNLGIINSSNIGLKHVNGDYIAKTDSDDMAKPYWIEKIMGSLLSNNEIIAMGSYISLLRSNNGGKLGQAHQTGEIWKVPLTHDEISKRMLFQNPMNNPTMIIRSKVFKEYNILYDLNYPYAEDYKFWFEVSKVGIMTNYPEALVHYRLHENQTSSVHHIKQTETAKKIRKEAINHYFKKIGIPYCLGKHINSNEIKIIINEISKIEPIEYDTLFNILYDCYMSMDKYNFSDFISFIKHGYKYLTAKQRRKVIKKFISPHKYAMPL